MKTIEDRDRLIAEALEKAPFYERDELINLVRRMKDCLDEGVLLSPKQAADAMGVSLKSIERYRLDHGLPFVKIAELGNNGRVFIYEHELHEWMRSLRYADLTRKPKR